MEKELNPTLHSVPNSNLPEAPDLDAVRGKVDGILRAADQMLERLTHSMAEDYLQQSRQRGAQ